MKTEADCASSRNKEERKVGKGCHTSPTLSCTQHHQNIGGVIVPPSVAQSFVVNDYSRSSRILQKSALAVPDPAGIRSATLSPVVEISNQATGVGVPDTALKSYMDDNVQPGPGSSATRATSGGAMGMSQASVTAESRKIKMTQSGVLYALNMIREPVVDYQETRGVPRNEEITFLTLVTSLCTQAYTAAITILVMLWNLMPLVDGLVYFVRFFLDKVIDIVQTEDNKDKAIKSAILFGEMTIITFIIFLIVGLIFMPVYVLMARLFSKIFSMIAW